MPARLARDAVSSGVEISAPNPEERSAASEWAHLRQLIGSAVRGGVCIDDPWRHAYLRARWVGQTIMK
jgi:hypothetical protein